MTTSRITREPTPVMFKRVEDDHEAIRHAWLELTARLGSLRGRRLFGIFGATTGEYRVSAQIRDRDDPVALRLEVGTMAGGSYLRARVLATSPAVYDSIPSLFAEMETQVPRDPRRPVIEFYRSNDTVDLLLPIPA